MDSPKAGLRAFGERVAAALEAETQPSEQLQLARARLLERVTSAGRREPRADAARRWSIGFALAGALALALALALATAVLRTGEARLSFETSAGARNVGDVLEADTRAPMRVSFSEGSRMLLQRGSRARVLDARPLGARVLLEGGALDVAVVHRDKTRWLFEAGPFHVLVKGTEFELDWEPAQQLLSLHMKSGRVELSGSCLPAPRMVERGASLRLSCAQPALASADRGDGPSATNPEVGATSQPAPAAATSAAQSAPAQIRPGRAGSVAAPSFEASCETATKAELVAWANHERLAGSAARARSALLALRRRFAGSSEAATAAFTLGRMAFEQQADYGQAASWFAAYLAEQPNGPLMGDAAGRLIEAHERRGDERAARRAAEAYLARFPDGPYAGKARRILAE